MVTRIHSKALVVSVGTRVPNHCARCGAESDCSQSDVAVKSVAKWFCPNCGTLNEVEIEFRKWSF